MYYWSRQTKKIFILAGLLLVASVAGMLGVTQPVTKHLSVAFLDVGQGDAIFVETPGGVQVLIDGGPDAAVVHALGAVMYWHDRSIDMIIGTHPDKDHIGGLVDVLSRYDVSTVLTTENKSDSTVGVAYQDAIARELATVHFARAGQVFRLDDDVTLTVLSPADNPAQLESNMSSIVVKIQYRDISILLTGDAPIGIEEYLVRQYGDVIDSDILKLGHHGSDTATSPIFLAAATPQHVVVSASADNSYGHPHASVMNSVATIGAIVHETKYGSIIFESDGATVWRRR